MNSVNHHYIPQLYLKGFTASNGKLQVFDKSLGHFKKDKQTPKTVFYSKHRNTIKFNGVETDKIEKLYSALESPFGTFFELIRGGISQDGLISEKGIYLLKLFIAIQFWRMPCIDNFADNFIKNIDLTTFGERITIEGIPIGENKNILRLIENDKGFRHYFRSFILPLLMFDLRVDKHDYICWKFHTVASEFSDWENILTSDNPIVIEDITKVFSFNSKLIFPLSKRQILIYSPNTINHTDLPPIFTTKLSMVMYAQSQKYLAGVNRNYIQQVIDLYLDIYGNEDISKLRKELFEYI